MERPRLMISIKKRQQWLSLLQLAWPLILANSFWNLQLTIDRIYLGQFSTQSLGAAMAVMAIFWTPMALLQQTAAYNTTFVAQYLGAHRTHRIGPVLWQSIYVSIIGGCLFLLLQFLSTPLFDWIGHARDVRNLEIEYFDAMTFSALPTALVAALSGVLIGLGKTKQVLLINGTGLLANVLFDYLLIFGAWGFPALGVAGAGYATGLANACACLCGVILVFRRDQEKTYRFFSGYQWDGELMQRFLKFGIPSGLQWSLEGLAFTCFLIVLGRFPNGEAALASSSIAVTIMMLAVLPAMGIAQAVMVLVGQNLGENQPAKAAQSAWNGVQLSMIYMAIMALSFFFIPDFYIEWFQNNKNLSLWNEVHSMTVILLMFVALFTTFDGITLNLSFALKGAGDTRFVSLVALMVPWPIMVIPSWLMQSWDGAVYWAWAAASLYAFTLAGIFTLRFRQGKWRSMRVISTTSS